MDFKQTLQDLLEATQKRDLDRLLSIMPIDEEVSLILPNGMFLRGRSTFINLNAAWFADPDWQMDVKILRTIETAEMGFALMLVDYRDATLGAEPYAKQHLFSIVCTKKDGEWHIVHEQNTIAQEAAS